MVREAFPAAKERALATVFVSHLGAGVALDSNPDEEAVEGAVIVRSVAEAILASVRTWAAVR